MSNTYMQAPCNTPGSILCAYEERRNAAGFMKLKFMWVWPRIGKCRWVGLSTNTLLQNNFMLGASFGVVKNHIRAAHVTQETSWPYSRCQQQQPALMNTGKKRNQKEENKKETKTGVHQSLQRFCCVLLASFNCLKGAPLIYLPNTAFHFAPLSNNEKQSRNAGRAGASWQLHTRPAKSRAQCSDHRSRASGPGPQGKPMQPAGGIEHS